MKRLCPLLPLLLALPLSGCGSGDDRGTTLTVFAAASLTSVFEELEEEYEDTHPDVDVRLSFGGSSDLATQIEQGAEADVFASADVPTMERLTAADLTSADPQEFATNTLTAVVAPGNPHGIRDVGDLTAREIDLVLCAPDVPCGRAAQEVAHRLGITFEPVSEEQSVTDVLAKVQAGEADAGLVYVSDARDAEDVDEVAMRDLEFVVNHYPIAVVEGAAHPDLAQDWIDLVLGDGRSVLSDAGFGPPAP